MESDSKNHNEQAGGSGGDDSGGGCGRGSGGGDLVLDIDGEQLIFSDDTFPPLPDFSCLPSPSPSTGKHPLLSSASSLSSSSSWDFITGVAGDENMQQQQQLNDVVSTDEQARGANNEPEIDMDILDDIDLLDLSAEPFDTSFLFPDDSTMIENDDDNAGDAAVSEQKGPPEEEDDGGLLEVQEPSEELSKIFLEWLKTNKDAISPEDLRNIKLKRSTIRCAASRLGGGKEGRAKLVKLILSWVQNHHLHKKRRRHRGQQQPLPAANFAQQQQAFLPLCHRRHFSDGGPINNYNPNPDYGSNGEFSLIRSNSWAPYPAMMMNYAGSSDGSGDASYRTATGAPNGFPTSSIAINNQPLDFHTANMSPPPEAWLPAIPQFPGPVPAMQQFPGPALGMPQFPGPAPAAYAQYTVPTIPQQLPIPLTQYTGGYSGKYSGGQQLYHQGQGLGGSMPANSATKEARKKRMARQRRFSSLHHQHRNQNQGKQQQQTSSQPIVAPETNLQPPINGRIPISVAPRSNARNSVYWKSDAPLTNPSTTMQQPAPLAVVRPSVSPPPPDATPTMPSPPQPFVTPSMPQKQQLNFQRYASTLDKPRGLTWPKSQKNLRFLLQKALKQSDVGSLGRIVLPKKEVEIHLPKLDSRDGISLAMEDIGTKRVWNMRYRYWPNNKSRMYVLENTGDFVRSNGLQEGDFIVIYWDIKCGKYMIRGLKVPHQQPELKKAAVVKGIAGKKGTSGKAGASKRKTASNCENEKPTGNQDGICI